MLKKIFIGSRYMRDERYVKATGYDHEIRAFYATRKPNWRIALDAIGGCILGAVLLAMFALMFIGFCACTDYNWNLIH